MGASVQRYLEANRLFLDLQDEINVSLMNTFLGICIWGYVEGDEGEPLTIKEISSRIGLPYTTVSRHVRYLGARQRVGKPGMGLVETAIYEPDHRQKIVRLTDKGQSFMKRILFVFGELED